VGSGITLQLTLRRLLADEQRLRVALGEIGKEAITDDVDSRCLNDRMYGLYVDILFWSGRCAMDFVRALIGVGIMVATFLLVFCGCIMTGLFGFFIVGAALLGFVISSFSSVENRIVVALGRLSGTICRWNTANPKECEIFCCKKRPTLTLLYRAVLDL
jgi:hypothetical protein